MDNQSLSFAPLSGNDIGSLAQLFRIAFTHFLNHSFSLTEKNYTEMLKIIPGCYMLTLFEKKQIAIDNKCLKTFQRYGNFRAYSDTIDALSQAFAEMTALIANESPLLDYPWYFKEFMVAMYETVGSNISRLYGDAEEVQRLLTRCCPSN